MMSTCMRRAAVLLVAAALAVAHGTAPEPLPIRVVFQLQVRYPRARPRSLVAHASKPIEPCCSRHDTRARRLPRAQDPVDGLCLSPRGFSSCDTSTLWTVGVASGRQSIVSFLNPRCAGRAQTG
jgi:hypothetical protein